MRLLINVFLIFKQAFSFVAYSVSFLFPRNKKLWLYGNLKGSFRDNSKYLFIYNSTHFTEINHIWISQSKDVVASINKIGFKAVYKFSPLAFWYALSAKVYIYNSAPTDTVHGCLRGKAYCFNLWHGIPFKKIEYDIKKGSFYKRFFNPIGLQQKIASFLFEPKLFRNSDGVLATSEKLTGIYCSAFKLKSGQVYIGPYPRNEIFNLSESELSAFINKYESTEFKSLINIIVRFKRVVIYMPTFRDDNPNFMDNAIPDFERLEQVCKQTNTLFLIKAHILTKFTTDLSKFGHIKQIDSNIDVYPLLPYTNALISDYSSIIFDYSLLNKKIIFYAFDKEEYLSKSREAYFEYDDVFSKDIIKDFEGLLHDLQYFDSKKKYEYPLPKSFLQNKRTMGDITLHIKESIKYQ